MWEKAPCRKALLKDIFRSVHKNLEILTEHLKLYQRFLRLLEMKIEISLDGERFDVVTFKPQTQQLVYYFGT